MAALAVSPVIEISLNNILYTCKPCGRNFNQAASFRRHREVAHSPEIDRKCVKCRVCGNTFASINTLTMHMVIHNTNNNEFKLNSEQSKRLSHISDTSLISPVSKKLKFNVQENIKDNNNNISDTFIIRVENKNSIAKHIKINTAIVKPILLKDNIKVVYLNDEPTQIVQVKQEPLFFEYNSVSDKEEIGTVVLNAIDFDLTHLPKMESIKQELEMPINTKQRITKQKQITSSSPVSFICLICKKGFSSEKYLTMHKALHEVQNPAENFMSDIYRHADNENFTAEQQLISDLNHPSLGNLKQLSNTPWTCKICLKKFAQNSNFKNHMRTHSDERPFVCSICCIGFKERYHLKKHQLFKHSTELKEQCRFCAKRFKDSTAVRAHERIHSDVRPYICKRCTKAFKTSECLWHHENRSKTCGIALDDQIRKQKQQNEKIQELTETQQSINTKNFAIQPISNKILVSTNRINNQILIPRNKSFIQLLPSMNQTIASIQPIKIEPTNIFPAKAFPMQNDQTLKPNSKIKTEIVKPTIRSINCEKCSNCFLSESALSDHMKLCNTGFYHCFECDITFKLKVHLKKHELYRHSKDLKCFLCTKKYKNFESLKNHFENEHKEQLICICGKSFKKIELFYQHIEDCKMKFSSENITNNYITCMKESRSACSRDKQVTDKAAIRTHNDMKDHVSIFPSQHNDTNKTITLSISEQCPTIQSFLTKSPTHRLPGIQQIFRQQQSDIAANIDDTDIGDRKTDNLNLFFGENQKLFDSQISDEYQSNYWDEISQTISQRNENLTPWIRDGNQSPLFNDITDSIYTL